MTESERTRERLEAFKKRKNNDEAQRREKLEELIREQQKVAPADAEVVRNFEKKRTNAQIHASDNDCNLERRRSMLRVCNDRKKERQIAAQESKESKARGAS